MALCKIQIIILRHQSNGLYMGLMTPKNTNKGCTNPHIQPIIILHHIIFKWVFQLWPLASLWLESNSRLDLGPFGYNLCPDCEGIFSHILELGPFGCGPYPTFESNPCPIPKITWNKYNFLCVGPMKVVRCKILKIVNYILRNKMRWIKQN
jgi:hypothetical protein